MTSCGSTTSTSSSFRTPESFLTPLDSSSLSSPDHVPGRWYKAAANFPGTSLVLNVCESLR
eukprot:487421-Rhodomonas_salina.1